MKGNESDTLRSRAYRAIRDKIIYLELRPGDKLSESELTKALGLGRTPVREALLMLEHEKLVVCDATIGFMVRRFSGKDLEEYFTVRNAIEEIVISLVVERITGDEIAALEDNLNQAEKAIEEGSIRDIVRCETEFHDILYRAAKSEVLFETVSRLVDKFQWFRALALSVPGAARNSRLQHVKILDLIKRKDVEGLKDIMKEHLGEAKGRVAALPGLLL